MLKAVIVFMRGMFLLIWDAVASYCAGSKAGNSLNKANYVELLAKKLYPVLSALNINFFRESQKQMSGKMTAIVQAKFIILIINELENSTKHVCMAPIYYIYMREREVKLYAE